MTNSNFTGRRQRLLRNRFRRWTTASLLGLTLGLTPVGTPVGSPSVNAEEPKLSLSDLEQRIQSLERQNQQLRESLLDRLPSLDDETRAPTATRSILANSPQLEMTRFSELMEAYRAEEAAKAGLSPAGDFVNSEPVGAAGGQGSGHEVGSDLSMTASWKDGLELSTKNKDFRVHIGGRTQFDVGWFNVDSNVYDTSPGFAQPTSGLSNVYGDGVDVRRARLRIDGTMYEQIEWAAEYDFANSTLVDRGSRTLTTVTAVPAPTDLWWAFKDVPGLGMVKIGNQKEAIGFEHIVSSRFLPFMERSYNQDTFYGGAFNGFNPGITASGTYGEDEIGTYNVGLFKPTNNVFGYNTGDGDFSITGRLTRLLWWEDDGRRMFHVGGSLRQATAVSTAVGAASNCAGSA